MEDWAKQLRAPLNNINYKPSNKVYDHKIKMTLRQQRDKENMGMVVNQRNNPLDMKMPNPTTLNNSKSRKYWGSETVNDGCMDVVVEKSDTNNNAKVSIKVPSTPFGPTKNDSCYKPAPKNIGVAHQNKASK